MRDAIRLLKCKLKPPKKAPTGQHVFALTFFWGDFTSIWVCLYSFYLLYLIHNSKGYKHSGLFCTKFKVLWFVTLVILPVKLEISLILIKFICKAVLNNPSYVHLYPFCSVFRALWPATTLVTGAPMPPYPVHWAP